LADQRETVRISSTDSAGLQFIHHLGVAGEVLVGHQIFGSHAGDGLAHAVAVTVLNDSHPSGLHQTVFKVIDIGANAAVQQIAVGVMRIRGGAVTAR
jgi:hypothetical protein